MSTIPLIIRAPNPNNQGFLSDLLMLKRSPGPRVRDAPSSTRRLPKKSSSVFRLPAIVTPQRRSLLDGTVLSNRRNGYRGCKRTTKFGLLSRAHVTPLLQTLTPFFKHTECGCPWTCCMLIVQWLACVSLSCKLSEFQILSYSDCLTFGS